ncbi:MAG: cysteine desulfurase family protein [Oscillospiraceae bacterium]|nr:cysteine desulfurase family protein [Oscillospiraceae bacterium]
MECYFDNSATTKPCQEAVDAAVDALTNRWGNPSSLHKPGDGANRLLTECRKTVAATLRAQPEEIVFTGCGTDSNNLAIFGSALALRRRGKRIVTTDIEHPSVEEPMKRLEEFGFEVVRLPVDSAGTVSKADLTDAVTPKTILVSMMMVNNEVGSIQPVKAAAAAVRRTGAPALIHTDCVQAYGKMPLNPKQLGVDLLSASGHKIHGPKGVGFLYVRKGVRLKPYLLGGGQERGLRSGTEAMPNIAGFAAAAAAVGDLSANRAHVQALRDSLVEQVQGGVVVVNSAKEALPYVLNLSVPGIPSEVLRNFLSERGIYVSTGSACSKGHRSRVLQEMGLSPERIDSAVRISFSRYNTQEEVDYTAAAIREAIATLRKHG